MILDVPNYDQLMKPTIDALVALGGSGTVQEILAKIIELEGFDQRQQEQLHVNGPTTELAYRSAWARTYLKKVGALDNSARGVWSLTDEGRSLTPADIAAIPRAVRAMDRPASTKSRTAGGAAATDPAEEWRVELLGGLLEAPPDAFERLSQRLLREANFVSVEVTGKSGDGGIDGIGVYRLSLVGFPVFFQCKRYKGSVGSAAVRDFRGAMAGRGDRGLLITTGTFTSEAKAEANRQGAPPIDLIDGYQLCDLLKEYRLGVSVTPVTSERVTVDVAFFAAM